MKKIIVFFLLIPTLLAGCANMPFFATPTSTPSSTPTLTPTVTASITPSATITPTFTPSVTPTPTWVAMGPGVVYIPIILYHHIDVSPINSEYYVPPERFDQQMKLLYDWGYSTITAEMLAQAINAGTALPPRPILITFDDGDHSVYDYAFPIMQKYGFTGTAYLVYYYLDTPGFVTREQVKQLAAYGWEMGSHSLTHANLTLVEANVNAEVVDSRKRLESELGVPILTIAYPFGALNSAVADYAHFAGYIAGMGLGPTTEQGPGNLFYLQRRDIKGSYNLNTFASFLPWQGDPVFLPIITPTP